MDGWMNSCIDLFFMCLSPGLSSSLSSSLTRQWYRIRTANGSDGSDSAASLAWYFLPEELSQLECVTASAAQPPSTSPSRGTGIDSDIFDEQDIVDTSASSSTAVNDDDDPPHPLASISFLHFCHLARITRRTGVDAIDDVLLVKLVNRACDRVGVDPINLSPTALADELTRLRTDMAAAAAAAAAAAGAALPAWLHDGDGVAARFVVLLHLNQIVLRVLPFVCLSPRVETGFIGAGAGASVTVTGPGSEGLLSERWRGAGVGRWLRRQRACLFRGTKLAFWNDVLSATATPTALSQVCAHV